MDQQRKENARYTKPEILKNRAHQRGTHLFPPFYFAADELYVKESKPGSETPVDSPFLGGGENECGKSGEKSASYAGYEGIAKARRRTDLLLHRREQTRVILISHWKGSTKEWHLSLKSNLRTDLPTDGVQRDLDEISYSKHSTIL